MSYEDFKAHIAANEESNRSINASDTSTLRDRVLVDLPPFGTYPATIFVTQWVSPSNPFKPSYHVGWYEQIEDTRPAKLGFEAHVSKIVNNRGGKFRIHYEDLYCSEGYTVPVFTANTEEAKQLAMYAFWSYFAFKE